MTDDELEARLRRLHARPDKDAQFWDGMAADVRAAYDAAAYDAAASPARTPRRRRPWVASVGGALALAAAFALWVRAHHGRSPATAEPADTFHVFEDLEPGEMLEELSPDEVDRVAKAFNKGA
jgi:hypothetical protein